MRAPPFPQKTRVLCVTCGISTPFGVLSPARGQIIHVLLTRAPLYSRGEPLFLARLACVRPAANVRSEPGSNSPLIFVDDVSSDFIPTRLCRARGRGSSESGFACWHKTHNSSRYSVFKDRLLALASRGYYLYRRNLSTPVQPSAFGVPPGAVALEGAGFYHVGREREVLFRFFFALSLAALRLSSTSRWAWKDLNFRPRAYQARALTS